MATLQWSRFELALTSAADYPNPLQDTSLRVTFTSPSGKTRRVDGFWDGDTTWRVRFSPDEIGQWRYVTTCADQHNSGLQGQSGTVECRPSQGQTRFDQHGPLHVSDNRCYLVHADGTPFFWLADTVWNGPLHSTPEEWDIYLKERTRQKFTAAQWVATQYVGSPVGSREHQYPFSGHDRIAVNPEFFQRLDARHQALNEAGLLSVIALLWAAEWSDPAVNEANPGYVLPEDQLILLARYMIARWGADHVAYFLAGDGPYLAEKAAKWQRIGRAVFGDEPHAPVTMHPCGMNWILDEFKDEPWYDFLGYQSGHGDDQPTMAWLNSGPPATEWKAARVPIINLEPPYEDHVSYQTKTRFSAYSVRRASYWSLLVSPTAGVSYGGHGVWGWDSGGSTPMGHPTTGIARPWREALLLPGAEQMAYLFDAFDNINWWRLRPAPELIASQPGDTDKGRFIAAARSEDGDLAVIYIPGEASVTISLDGLTALRTAVWVNPRNGERQSAALSGDTRQVLSTPGPDDWLLLLSQ